MSTLQGLYHKMIAAMGVEGLLIPLSAVKFYRHTEKIPQAVLDNQPEGITLTSCQAARQSSLGDAVFLTIDNIGCVAAAITFGLVDARSSYPIGRSLVYTNIMEEQSGLAADVFTPPAPVDFTDGIVYACRDAGRPEFCLFGKDDAGRFKDVQTSKDAVTEMTAIQPPVMKGVFFYSLDFTELDIVPDVVLLSLRPVELARIIQAYQYNTGERVTASMGGLRVVNSDLIVRPYLTGRINVSTYCLGARLIARYEADRLGMGIPFALFETIVQGMEDSKTGFPFPLYPGASRQADSEQEDAIDIS